MSKCNDCEEDIIRGDIYYTIESRKMVLTLSDTANISYPKRSNRYCAACFLKLVGAKEVLLF